MSQEILKRFKIRAKKALGQNFLQDDFILEEIANTYAWRWGLIALSRPIDTLILQLDDVDSKYSKQIMAIANGFTDFVDFID